MTSKSTIEWTREAPGPHYLKYDPLRDSLQWTVVGSGGLVGHYETQAEAIAALRSAVVVDAQSFLESIAETWEASADQAELNAESVAAMARYAGFPGVARAWERGAQTLRIRARALRDALQLLKQRLGIEDDADAGR